MVNSEIKFGKIGTFGFSYYTSCVRVATTLRNTARNKPEKLVIVLYVLWCIANAPNVTILYA